jgi:hypothetical protein
MPRYPYCKGSFVCLMFTASSKRFQLAGSPCYTRKLTTSFASTWSVLLVMAFKSILCLMASFANSLKNGIFEIPTFGALNPQGRSFHHEIFPRQSADNDIQFEFSPESQLTASRKYNFLPKERSSQGASAAYLIPAYTARGSLQNFPAFPQID